MNSVKEKAYAKINLYLDVTGKRPDGFHEIETVMHSVSLCDELTLTLLSEGHRAVRLSIDGAAHLPSDGKNIVYTAVMEFMEQCGINAEIGVRLVKRIPVAAGLAGGSSDAAAALRGMNRLFGRRLTAARLMSIAERLGSDVPYCLLGGTALCRGRGEQMSRLGDGLHLYTVIAVANEHVSTPAAYAALDDIYSDFDGTVAHSGADLGDLLSDVNSGDLSHELYNIFEEAILPRCPGASVLRHRLSLLGASFALMSGSGPSVFGVFTTAEQARKAADALNADGIFASCAESVC